MEGLKHNVAFTHWKNVDGNFERSGAETVTFEDKLLSADVGLYTVFVNGIQTSIRFDINNMNGTNPIREKLAKAYKQYKNRAKWISKIMSVTKFDDRDEQSKLNLIDFIEV